MNSVNFTSRQFSYIGSQYTYHYHNRGKGDKAYVSIQIKKVLIDAFIAKFWARTHTPKIVGTLFASRGFGWYRIEAMDALGEAGVKKFMRMLRVFLQPEVVVPATRPLVRKYAVVTDITKRRMRVVLPLTIPVSYKEVAAMVITPASPEPVAVAASSEKISALLAKFSKAAA